MDLLYLNFKLNCMKTGYKYVLQMCWSLVPTPSAVIGDCVFGAVVSAHESSPWAAPRLGMPVSAELVRGVYCR